VRDGTHTYKLGRLAEDLAIVKLSTLFNDCVVSQVVNNQHHDLEIRKKEETLVRGICKIQVKSTNSKHVKGTHKFYAAAIHHSKGRRTIRYEKDDADFFLFYVYPEGKFYVFPSEVVNGLHGMKLYVGLPYPSQGKAVYEKYIETWQLIANFLGYTAQEEQTNLL